MAKDSNKRAVLARRKVELAHAVNNDFSNAIIAKRIGKLRFAAVKFIKKVSGHSIEQRDGYLELTEKWDSLSHAEIIRIADQCPANPSIRDLHRTPEENSSTSSRLNEISNEP